MSGGEGGELSSFLPSKCFIPHCKRESIDSPTLFFFPFNLHIKRQGLKFSNKNKVVNCKEPLSDNHYASEIAQPIIKF